MIIYISIIACILSIIALLLLRLYLTNNMVFAGGDAFFHLLISRSIRNNHWRYPSSLRNVTFDEGEKKYNYLAYPPLLHYATALFPQKFHLAVSKYLNLVLLSFIASLAAALTYTLTSNAAISLVASLIVVFNMAVFELEVMFTPRPLGLLVFSILILVVMSFETSLMLVLIVSVLSSLIILTHKFATQVLVFTLIPYAVIFNESLLLLGLVFGLLLTILVTRGSYLKVLKEHFSWLYFYSRFPFRCSFAYKLRRIFVRNVWYLVAGVFIVIALLQNGLSDLNMKLLFWVFTPLIIALIITIPQLSFLGEDYRYVEYSVVPVGVLVAFSLLTLNIFVLLSFLISLSATFFVLLKYRRHILTSRWLVEKEDIRAYGLLNSLKLSNLLVFPPNRTLEVNFFSQVSVISPVRKKEAETLTQHFEALLRKYNVKYVLRFSDIDPYDRFLTFSQLVKMEKVLSSKNFDILRIIP